MGHIGENKKDFASRGKLCKFDGEPQPEDLARVAPRDRERCCIRARRELVRFTKCEEEILLNVNVMVVGENAADFLAERLLKPYRCVPGCGGDRANPEIEPFIGDPETTRCGPVLITRRIVCSTAVSIML